MMSLFRPSAVAALLGAIVVVALGAGDDTRPDFNGAVGWLNSPAVNVKALRGRVVLVNFWTYSCINSLRELPYIQAWAAKYRGAGLVVVGVHAPEFGFERVPQNVQTAVSDLRITFPVAIDSDHAIWSAFRNEYWPADYLIDAQGKIRYRHFGEGDYEASERAIQALLRESGTAGVDGSIVRPIHDGVGAPPSRDVRSPETYAGYARAENYDDRLEIWSDGTLPFGLSVDDLKRDHLSRPRNPLIAEVFYRRGLVERWGRGTQKIVELCVQAGHPQPEFIEQAGAVGVRFLPSGYIAPHRVAHDLTKRQREILQALAGRQEVSFGDLRARVAPMVAVRTFRDDLLHLKRLGMIGLRGRGRGASWFLTAGADAMGRNKAE